MQRSRQSDPGFQTPSAKALRWPELVNGAGGGGGPGFPESQVRGMERILNVMGAICCSTESLTALCPISVQVGRSACCAQMAGASWGGNGEEVVALEEPRSEASAEPVPSWIWC